MARVGEDSVGVGSIVEMSFAVGVLRIGGIRLRGFGCASVVADGIDRRSVVLEPLMLGDVGR